MKNQSYLDKVALVTGGSRGIGKGISLRLLSMGFSVAVNGVTSKDLPKDFIDDLTILGKSELGKSEQNSSNYTSRIQYIQADIASKEDRKRLVEAVINKFHRIDVLVNNAGVGPSARMDILEATEDNFSKVLETNLKGPYFLTQNIANEMIKTVKSQKIHDYKPKIINISSISSYTSSTNRGEYCISKAGISMMTKLYADRLAEFGIGVFEIQPGIIKTDMTAGVQDKYDKMFKAGLTPINRWGTPEDIAQAVEAIVSDHFPYSTGQVFEVDGGFHLRRL